LLRPNAQRGAAQALTQDVNARMRTMRASRWKEIAWQVALMCLVVFLAVFTASLTIQPTWVFSGKGDWAASTVSTVRCLITAGVGALVAAIILVAWHMHRQSWLWTSQKI
jgi:spore maturation protein SpmA